jgi:hypothetical protein
MAVIEVERVQVARLPEAIYNFALDTPVPGTQLDVYDIEFSGWVIGASSKAVAIVLHSGSQPVRRAAIDQLREDVAATFPDAPHATISGFRTSVNVVGLEPNAPLDLTVVLEDQSRHLLARVTYGRQPLATNYTPRLQPLMLTTLGRAGTTWMMRVLAEHPSIAIHREHPYELRIARHWLHAFKVLTEPRDPSASAQADTFQNDRSWAGHSPFYPLPLGAVPAAGQWFGKTYVEDFGATVQRWIDECYGRIAAGQDTPNPVYFGEKHRPDSLPWLVWELYPQAKEIFLVRDFRDVISSMLSYNARHGRPVFGPKEPVSNEEFVRYIYQGPIQRVATAWQKRHERATLIRYEDLIANPAATLTTVLAYLELDASEATVARVLERASAENPDMQRHRTSAAVSESVGRWESSLSPSVQSVCEDVLGDVLQQFGYSI